jgi:hypothetical protein
MMIRRLKTLLNYAGDRGQMTDFGQGRIDLNTTVYFKKNDLSIKLPSLVYEVVTIVLEA